MDGIKMEPGVDPLDLQPHDNTCEIRENTTLSEEGNLSHLQVAGIKTECVDRSYDLTSEIKVEDTPELVSSPIVKSELESTSVPLIFATVKCEVDEDSFYLDIVQQEEKVDISSKEDEVLLESSANNVTENESSECGGIASDEQKLTRCSSKSLRSSIACDLSCETIKSNISNEISVTPQSLERQNHALKKSFKCDICGKCFSSSGKIKVHFRIHTGERPFKCDLCGKCFSQSGSLKYHSRIHTGERPFKCDMCGRCFSQVATLNYHSRIHTGERPFKCDQCDKCFINSSCLKRHSRIHSADIPYKCDVCGMYFSRSEYLKKHIRVHSRQRAFKCEVCEKTFSHLGSMQRHRRGHPLETRFKCDFCGKNYTHIGNLKKHIALHTDQR